MKFEVRRRRVRQNLESGPPRDRAEMPGGTAGVCAPRRHLLRLPANRSWASANVTLTPGLPRSFASTQPGRQQDRCRFLPSPRRSELAASAMSLRPAAPAPVPCPAFHQCPASLFDSSTIRSSGVILAATIEQLPVQSRIAAASIQVSIGCGGSQPVLIAGSLPSMAREWLFGKPHAGDELVNEFKFVQ